MFHHHRLQQIGCANNRVLLYRLLAHLSQLEDSLTTLDFEMSEEHIRRLDEVSAIDFGFPRNFLQRDDVREFMSGGTYNQIDNPHSS